MREALLYDTLPDGRISCRLCAHRCRIQSGARGICGVRENRDGVLYSRVYGKVVAGNVDPIEKKPLFHFYPGSTSFSIATAGCNFRCDFCQNHSLSQSPRESEKIPGQTVSPEEIVRYALQSGARSISYTYTEPTVYFEYALDTARLAHEKGLKNVFVTNGFMTVEALDTIAPVLDGANVDLKSFRDDFYKTWCGGRLAPVLEALRRMKELGVWVEVTTLLIPGLNDSEAELAELAGFVAGLGRDTPWHVSRFHPLYRMGDRPVTPAASIHRAVRIGKETGLPFVYSGNLPGDEGEHTYCAACGTRLIRRLGFVVQENALNQGRCSRCGAVVAGRF